MTNLKSVDIQIEIMKQLKKAFLNCEDLKNIYFDSDSENVYICNQYCIYIIPKKHFYIDLNNEKIKKINIKNILNVNFSAECYETAEATGIIKEISPIGKGKKKIQAIKVANKKQYVYINKEFLKLYDMDNNIFKISTLEKGYLKAVYIVNKDTEEITGLILPINTRD